MKKRADTLKLSAKLYGASILERLQALDWQQGSSAPLIIELDPTEHCNLACLGCVSEDLIANKQSFSNTRLMALGHEFIAAGVKGVVLIGGGEPLAHPKVGELITLLGEHGIHVGLTTNGTLIHKYLTPIARYVNWTRVSMDAGCDATFKRLRPAVGGASHFYKVIENMRLLAKEKTGRLGYSFLIRTEADGFNITSNIDDLYPAACLAKEIGCDYFEVKPSNRYYGGVDHYLVVHSKENMARATQEIERLMELESDTFVILRSVNLNYSLAGLSKHEQPKDYHSCPVADLRTLISPSGVYVCPYFRGRESMRVGSVVDQSLQDMWRGEQRRQVMEELDPSIHCGMHCIRHESNLALFDMQRKLAAGENLQANDSEDPFI
ncbi:MAG: radical SAM protein [Magnetococcales bacterium]|nr:radical SAM protein [Magnetococcales bacterium]